MKRITAFILLFLPAIAVAQIARQQINDLHSGMLLVRLQTYDKKIAAMQKAGKTVDAENFKTRIEKMNQDLVSAFSRNYNFSPVYFFYGRNSEAIKARNFKDILFDASLKTIDLNQKTGDPFFIAEIAFTESDTTKLSSFEEYQFKDSTGYESKKTYYENDNIHYLALLIRSDQFVQLRKPFPAYVNFRSYDQIPVKTKKIDKAVIELDEKLNNYYKKNKNIEIKLLK